MSRVGTGSISLQDRAPIGSRRGRFRSSEIGRRLLRVTREVDRVIAILPKDAPASKLDLSIEAAFESLKAARAAYSRGDLDAHTSSNCDLGDALWIRALHLPCSLPSGSATAMVSNARRGFNPSAKASAASLLKATGCLEVLPRTARTLVDGYDYSSSTSSRADFRSFPAARPACSSLMDLLVAWARAESGATG